MPTDVYMEIHILDILFIVITVLWTYSTFTHMGTQVNIFTYENHIYLLDNSYVRVCSVPDRHVSYALLLSVIVIAIITTHVHMLFNLSHWIKPFWDVQL